MEDQIISRCEICGRVYDAETDEIIDESKEFVVEDEWGVCNNCDDEDEY